MKTKAHGLTDVGQGSWRFADQPVSHFDDLGLDGIENFEGFEQVTRAGGGHRHHERVGGIEILDEITELGLALRAYRPIKRHRVARCPERRLHPLGVQPAHL